MESLSQYTSAVEVIISHNSREGKWGTRAIIDLLFFNRELKSLVCIELKKGEFKPSYLGQLAAYLRILDDEEKLPDENPSIGVASSRRRIEEINR